MPKFDVTAIWTRTFTKTIEVEAPDEETAERSVKTSLEAALAARSADQETWDFESEDIDIASVDEAQDAPESQP